MRIGVTTPTGHVGRHVAAALVRAGVTPVLLTRNPAGLDAGLRGFVGVVEVDQFDEDSVAAATVGLDALFWVDPTTGSADPLADYDRASRAVARAVTENGINRVVFQSSVGAERRHGVGEIDGLAATEVALDATDADVCHLRCGYFFTNLELQLDAIKAGTIPVVVPPDLAMPWIAPRDIGEVAAAHLLASEWTGRRVTAVHGPKDLTWTEVADILSETLGRPVRVERITDDAMRDVLRSAGMTDGLVEAVIGMSAGLRDGFTPEQPRSYATTTPTTLTSWVYDELRPQLN